MELDLSNLGLKKLPMIPKGVTILRCDNNEIKFIKDLPDSLLELYCSNNKITQLENLPKNLSKLECKNNYISQINLYPNVKTINAKYQKRLNKNHSISDIFLDPVICYIIENKNIFDDGIEVCKEEFDFM